MRVALLLEFVLILVVNLEIVKGCDEHGIHVYKDLGCQPIKNKPEDPCPSSYHCGHFHDFGDHCYFQGNKYAVDEEIPSNVTGLSCDGRCVCKNKGSFTCSPKSCPPWEKSRPLSANCFRTYSLNECCSISEVCLPFDGLAKCTVDGITYLEGQKFYPRDRCLQCVCQQGFTGEYVEPFCRPTSCAVELRDRNALKKHCAPVYKKKEARCCPKFWSCLSDDDVIDTADLAPPSKQTCIFGSKFVRVGAVIEKTQTYDGTVHNLRCECYLPPLLSCITQNS